ncbi:MAG: hypothetical protein AAF696_39610, partial [Bacteroidota bacterium]
RNSKIDDKRKELYHNKAKYFMRLCDAKEIHEFEALKEEIIRKKDAASPNWLIEKCEENMDWLGLQ